MSKLFLDTNVVLDFIEKREPFAETARDLLLAAAHKKHELLVSSLTFITIHYVVSKRIGKVAATEALQQLFARLTVATVDSAIISQALRANTPDFEDAVQLYAALAAGADTIVTRDPKGFPTQQVPVLNPLAALAQL